jgi:hypothetical protein
LKQNKKLDDETILEVLEDQILIEVTVDEILNLEIIEGEDKMIIF